MTATKIANYHFAISWIANLPHDTAFNTTRIDDKQAPRVLGSSKYNHTLKYTAAVTTSIVLTHSDGEEHKC